jgi:hypothetical protein
MMILVNALHYMHVWHHTNVACQKAQPLSSLRPMPPLALVATLRCFNESMPTGTQTARAALLLLVVLALVLTVATSTSTSTAKSR